MNAFMIAVFEDHPAAERARTELVSRGFPTDRVELTSTHEPGQAAALPANTLTGKLEAYFDKLFENDEGGHPPVRQLVDRVRAGGGTITVHPRGEVEIEQAREILQGCSAVALIERGIETQSRLEHAASERSPFIDTRH
jgi:hypothetical protein